MKTELLILSLLTIPLPLWGGSMDQARIGLHATHATLPGHRKERLVPCLQHAPAQSFCGSGRSGSQSHGVYPEIPTTRLCHLDSKNWRRECPALYWGHAKRTVTVGHQRRVNLSTTGRCVEEPHGSLDATYVRKEN